ncbi:MAG: hypothetical protein JWR32_407 [Mycobacterium sp.]|nr:hypothetical protein [Mycobacterium sp.]
MRTVAAKVDLVPMQLLTRPAADSERSPGVAA